MFGFTLVRKWCNLQLFPITNHTMSSKESNNDLNSEEWIFGEKEVTVNNEVKIGK